MKCNFLNFQPSKIKRIFLKDSDEEMASIVSTIRENDRRAHEARQIPDRLVAAGDDLPSYESLFPPAISSEPPKQVTPSLVGQTSEVSEDSIPESSSSKIGQIDPGAKYQPSMWYYEPGENPIRYELGQKVSNPFTEPLRALQTEGDRKKLKQIVTRHDFIFETSAKYDFLLVS